MEKSHKTLYLWLFAHGCQPCIDARLDRLKQTIDRSALIHLAEIVKFILKSSVRICCSRIDLRTTFSTITEYAPRVFIFDDLSIVGVLWSLAGLQLAKEACHGLLKIQRYALDRVVDACGTPRLFKSKRWVSSLRE